MHLARRIGEVVPCDDLLEAVWGYPAGQGDRKLVTNCVGRVRRKLGEDPSRPEYVVTVRGVGTGCAANGSGKPLSSKNAERGPCVPD